MGSFTQVYLGLHLGLTKYYTNQFWKQVYAFSNEVFSTNISASPY